MIREFRTLTVQDLEALCVSKGWYTHDTKKRTDWKKLVKRLQKYYANKTGLNTNNLNVVARDIFLHSDTGETIFDIFAEIVPICSITLWEEK